MAFSLVSFFHGLCPAGGERLCVLGTHPQHPSTYTAAPNHFCSPLDTGHRAAAHTYTRHLRPMNGERAARHSTACHQVMHCHHNHTTRAASWPQSNCVPALAGTLPPINDGQDMPAQTQCG